MTNNKRKWKAIGASLCAMALAISTGSMAVSAASPSGNDEIAMTQSVQSKECQVRQNETTGKMEMSLDNGKTWEALPDDVIQQANLVSSFVAEGDGAQVRKNEETGKVEMSLDNGKTWEEAKETDIQFASEVSTAQARQAEDGKIELSEDGGKTWKGAEESLEAIQMEIRQNPETGKYEISSDEGKTWTEATGEHIMINGEESVTVAYVTPSTPSQTNATV